MGPIDERLRGLLHYDSDTGVFTWRVNRRRVKTGDIAGTVNAQGYVQICIDGRLYLAHRLAWLYVHGEWPSGDLDHWDTNRANNVIGNLRPATNSQNQANSRQRRDNTSGYKGVCWDKRCHRWVAGIYVDGRRRHLGRFDTPEAGHAAYCNAASEYFGEFARVA